MTRIAWPIAAILTLATSVCAAEPEVSATLDRGEVFEGQAVLLKVRIDNVKSPARPDLGKLDDFDAVFAGDNPFDFHSVQIVNGQRSEFVQQGCEYHYRLTPKKPGLLTVPALAIKVDGKTLHTTPLALRVVPAGKQDLAMVELRVDRDRIYPTQSFTVTLSVTVKPVPGGLARYEPVAVQQSPPMLTIPWADDDKLPSGLRPERTTQRWLQSMVDERGFGINRLAQTMLFGQHYVNFRTPPRRVARAASDGQMLQYWQYEFPRQFIAMRPGQYTLGPATLQGTFAAEAAGATRPVGKEVFAVAQPVTITVKDPPTEGRPASYVGVVGRFEARAEIAPREAKIGDPITLTLTLTGRGSLDSATAPKLDRVPDVARRFKLYEATQQAEPSGCRFTYSLRPLVESSEPFPAVPLACFDPDTERYLVVHTAPVPIRIAAAARLSQDQIVGAPRGAARSPKELETRREGVFANLTDPALVRDESVRPERWLWGLAGLALAYASAATAVVTIRRRAADPALVRRRGAAMAARRRLQQAQLLTAEKPREAADALQAALAGLVADVADLPQAGLTPKDVVRQMETFALDAGLVARVRELLETCDAARYGVSTVAPPDLAAQTERVLEELIAALRRERRFA
jgi:hypothetical protein